MRKYNKNETKDYYYMDEMDSNGRYKNIIYNNNVSYDIYQNILDTLPNRSIRSSQFWKPEWLKKNVIDVIEDNTEINVTYINEKAGYKNVLGYVIYNTDAPPRNIKDLKKHIIIFPNLSDTKGSISGDTIKLASEWTIKEDGKTINITNTKFSKNSSILFFVISDGWRNNKISTHRRHYFSNPKFNPETVKDLKHHFVVIETKNNENKFIIGIEDIHKQNRNCDHDHNDGIFLIEVTSKSNIENNFGVKIKEEEEIISYKGTLLFEDMDRNEDGDYNDIFSEYNIIETIDRNGKIKKINMHWILKSKGAVYDHDMLTKIPISDEDTLSIQEYYNKEKKEKVVTNKEQSYVDIFNSTKRLLNIWNTKKSEKDKKDNAQVNISIEFKNPIERTFGYPPYTIRVNVFNEKDKRINTFFSDRKYTTDIKYYNDLGINEIYKIFIIKDYQKMKILFEKKPLYRLYYRFIDYIHDESKDEYWYEDHRYHLDSKYNFEVEKINWE